MLCMDVESILYEILLLVNQNGSLAGADKRLKVYDTSNTMLL